jgi:predicted metalloprotease with PDZ domain
MLCLLLTAGAHGGDIHRYTVTVDYTLSRLSVEARFTGPVASIAARSSDAGQFLLDVRGCDSPPDIWLRNRRLLLPEGGIDCLNYTVDLARAAKENRQNRNLSDENIVVSPSAWLWRPELVNSTSIELRFRLPSDVRVSVPWQPVDSSRNIYRITRSPESSSAPVVFGDFDTRQIEVAGADLQLTVLASNGVVDNDALADWIQATATDVSLAYGRFPNPDVQIIVYPVGNSRGKSDSAVPFGRVVRDGGETVEFFVNENRPLEDYLDDWTATHEFSHLMLPFLGRTHRWVSEGFAQYYQNVLLARSGAYDEQRAWQKIYEGLERGRKSRPELSPNEAAKRGIRNSLMKVYWSGAAVALMADVALREHSDGQESLDTVLDRFQACCLPADREWSGEELFRKFDTLTSVPIFMPLYRRYADTAGFPDMTEVYERLGMNISDDVVRFRRSAELKHVRLAITETDTVTAGWRQQLAAN